MVSMVIKENIWNKDIFNKSPAKGTIHTITSNLIIDKKI